MKEMYWLALSESKLDTYVHSRNEQAQPVRGFVHPMKEMYWLALSESKLDTYVHSRNEQAQSVRVATDN
jgi:hypothetical protein